MIDQNNNTSRKPEPNEVRVITNDKQIEPNDKYVVYIQSTGSCHKGYIYEVTSRRYGSNNDLRGVTLKHTGYKCVGKKVVKCGR